MRFNGFCTLQSLLTFLVRIFDIFDASLHLRIVYIEEIRKRISAEDQIFLETTVREKEDIV